METAPGTMEHVRTVAAAVRREAAAMAADWASRDDAAWEAPTACRAWTARDVAAHVTDGAERAVVVLDTALAGGAVPQFNTQERRARHAALRALPGEELATRLQRDLDAVFTRLEAVPEPTLLATVVPLGGGPHTLAQFADQRLVETALHAWDVRAGSDPGATLTPESAAAMIDFVLWRVPRLAHLTEPRQAAPRYRVALEGPGGGPVTLDVGPDRVTATRAEATAADVALTLPVETFIRLVWGRADVGRALDAGTIRAEGPRGPIAALNAVFPGH
jgi:uncharacterized protein (TIGR03083 family)